MCVCVCVCVYSLMFAQTRVNVWVRRLVRRVSLCLCVVCVHDASAGMCTGVLVCMLVCAVVCSVYVCVLARCMWCVYMCACVCVCVCVVPITSHSGPSMAIC